MWDWESLFQSSSANVAVHKTNVAPIITESPFEELFATVAADKICNNMILILWLLILFAMQRFNYFLEKKKDYCIDKKTKTLLILTIYASNSI